MFFIGWVKSLIVLRKLFRNETITAVGCTDGKIWIRTPEGKIYRAVDDCPKDEIRADITPLYQSPIDAVEMAAMVAAIVWDDLVYTRKSSSDAVWTLIL